LSFANGIGHAGPALKKNVVSLQVAGVMNCHNNYDDVVNLKNIE